MPVYEYVCKQCGNHTEVSQSFKDAPLTVCAVCGGPLRKVFNSIGIVLKGSGFYRTDSRTPAKSEKRADKAEGKPSEPKPAEAKSGSGGTPAGSGGTPAGSGSAGSGSAATSSSPSETKSA